MKAQNAVTVFRKHFLVLGTLVTSALGTSWGLGAEPAPQTPQTIDFAALTDGAPGSVVPVAGNVPTTTPGAAANYATITDAQQLKLDIEPGETLLKSDPLPSGVALAPMAPSPMMDAVHGPVSGAAGCMACPTCPDRRYVRAEGIYMKREDDNGFGFSDRSRLDEFDYDWGMRITTGYVMDCMDGIEFSYTGLMDWNNDQTAQAPPALNLLFPLDPVLNPVEYDTFYNATAQFQEWEIQYDSFEVSRRSWGGDVISILTGVRMIRYDERFAIRSTNALVQQGLLELNTDNFLVGFQAGLDSLYPISRRLSTSFRGRAGVYGNFADGRIRSFNNGLQNFDVSDDDVDIAAVFELGSGLSYQLTPRLSLTAAYELWCLWNVATVADNRPARISPNIGRNLTVDDTVLIHGLTTGIEYRW